MDVYGIDFTSRPRRGKAITCLGCRFDGAVLRAGGLERLTDFAMFEAMLQRPGPWIAGLDFPFGQARRFLETIGWPLTWVEYVLHAEALGREGFRCSLTAYRDGRAAGDKEHRRSTDIAAGSISPQKLFGVPVGLMFLEGAPRLIRAGVTVAHLHAGDPGRIAVEAYPGVLARALIGRKSYKSDAKRGQTEAQHAARREIFERLMSAEVQARLGFAIVAEVGLADDPTGDAIDALLCAVQAAWAWQRRAAGYGAPGPVDPLEGWIVGPM